MALEIKVEECSWFVNDDKCKPLRDFNSSEAVGKLWFATTDGLGLVVLLFTSPSPSNHNCFCGTVMYCELAPDQRGAYGTHWDKNIFCEFPGGFDTLDTLISSKKSWDDSTEALIDSTGTVFIVGPNHSRDTLNYFSAYMISPDGSRAYSNEIAKTPDLKPFFGSVTLKFK